MKESVCLFNVKNNLLRFYVINQFKETHGCEVEIKLSF